MLHHEHDPFHEHTQTRTEKAAIVISTICMVHCLLLPVVAIAFPVLATTLLSEDQFHSMLLWFILPTSLIAITLGCRRHRDRFVIGLGALGLLLVSAAVFYVHHAFGTFAERAVTIAGSVALVLGHLRNQRLCRSDCHT